MLDQITPLILTYNEEVNIERTLAKLDWAQRIVVIDSGSTDGTLKILCRYSQVHVFYHRFEDFAVQWNFGLEQVSTRWVLSLDADYVLSDDLVFELRQLTSTTSMVGYSARFVYRICGRMLRGSLYPSRTVLFLKEKARYNMDGHTQRLLINGVVADLRGVIYHDDRKSLDRWFASQVKYAALEAEHLQSANRAALSRADRIRLMAWPAPILVFLYVLVAKGCLFDGWAGWFYALQRLLAETFLALKLTERRLALADREQQHQSTT
ncbi:MAG TPA: glycosyltransferase family 2 protein [Xanthobacteraceae bacterium]|nr:glycosyltransferase family 2 protein [Xanthobacteraceae bacterium]